MNDRNFKDFAVAYSIFNMMGEEPIKTNTFAKTLNVAFHIAKRVISKMSKSNIVKAQRGFNSTGVQKIKGVKVEDVFALYNIEYKSDPEIANDIATAMAASSYKARTCDMCEKEICFRSEFNFCKECQEATEEPTPMRIAKCGHPSNDRYFKCRSCLPLLAEEDGTEEQYVVYL